MSRQSKQGQSAFIARNRRASYDYTFEKTFEAGIVLEGWELKSIRAGQVQLVDSFVSVTNGEAILHNLRIAPLQSASTHVEAKPERPRTLLLHAKEIAEIYRASQVRGKTCVAVNLHWKKSLVKCDIAIAQGKRQYDKRRTIKEREWRREQAQSDSRLRS